MKMFLVLLLLFNLVFSQGMTDENPQGILIIESNMNAARWLLYKGDLLIQKGSGFQSQLNVPSSNHYFLRAEEMEGYSSSLTLTNPFSVAPNKTTVLKINYYPAFGTLEIKSSLPSDSALTINIFNNNGLRSYSETLYPHAGNLNWVNHQMPVGEYSIQMIPSAPELSTISRIFRVNPNTTTTLLPKFSASTFAKETPKQSVHDIKPAAPIKKPAPSSTTIAKPLERGWSSVPGGKSIIGDAFNESEINALPPKEVEISAFSIGTYEVTNAEYAYWLTQGVQTNAIIYATEGINKGVAFDREGHLLCKSTASEPLSQIRQIFDADQNVQFAPIGGKDHFPVIFVTWYGAAGYCQDQGGRLPTEAEWEKAAAVQSETSTTPLRKFRYGFSRDQINPSWANYKSNDVPLGPLKVKTTPVGFYNGLNNLTASLTTNNAKSPCGAYDMSGNVWEWVSDWYRDGYAEDFVATNPQGPSKGSAKVAKGGCYDSLASGVRAAERLSLPLDYCDIFTGFRIVK